MTLQEMEEGQWYWICPDNGIFELMQAVVVHPGISSVSFKKARRGYSFSVQWEWVQRYVIRKALPEEVMRELL